MNKQIRQSVFETNSSSTHSMSISPGNHYIPNVETMEIYTGYFGWEERVYTSIEDKLSYALTFALNNYSMDDLDMLNELLMENMPETEILYDGMTFEELSEINLENTDMDFGYIDHLSIGEASKMFFSKGHLEDFIFGTDSYFKTDNDNH